MPHALAVVLLLLATSLASLHANATLREVRFSTTHDAGFGNEVCVLGAHPALGGGDPLRAVKLAWNPGNLWSATVALPAGAELTYRFAVRSFSPGSWGNPANLTFLGGEQQVRAPAHPAPPWPGKVFQYRTSWADPHLLFRDRTGGGPWTSLRMRRVGDGRVAGEGLHQVEGFAASGSDIEFVFFDGTSTYDNAPAPPAIGAYAGSTAPNNYRTRADVLMVQDGQVFTYRPPAVVSPPRRVVLQVESTAPQIPGRPVTVILPRGYDQATWKRYPVVIFKDGQNVFSPGGPFGSWDADLAALHEMAQGRVREAILVAVPNGNSYGSDRLHEYAPTGDTVGPYLGRFYEGRGAAYARYLLDNLMPALAGAFRILGDAPNTIIAGSSMGGLSADYLVWLHPDRFGVAGIFSPAYWAAPNWVAARNSSPRIPVRRYLYMGTAESSTGESSSAIYWQGALSAYNKYVRDGHPVGAELVFEGGAGAAHNEAAWARRVPAFLALALDLRGEVSPLALDLHPPVAQVVADGAGLRLEADLLGGAVHELEVGDRPGNWLRLPLPGPADPWGRVSRQLGVETGQPAVFYRVISRVP